FRFVYVDPDESAETIRKHRRDFSLPAEAWIDRKHALVEWTGASITPEAAVVDDTGTLRYRGRIDDWYVDFGKARREPSVHDLEIALQARLRGETSELTTTKAVGCFIMDLAP
ncbi:MAG: peroxiredoxin, partial [Planctomycetota bacterium]|nr:peroxiredoxin [Planctomycetota bacterium]